MLAPENECQDSDLERIEIWVLQTLGAATPPRKPKNLTTLLVYASADAASISHQASWQAALLEHLTQPQFIPKRERIYTPPKSIHFPWDMFHLMEINQTFFRSCRKISHTNNHIKNQWSICFILFNKINWQKAAEDFWWT